MTVLCGGGTSSPKTGFGSTVAMTASSIAALLNNIPTVWAVPLAGLVGIMTYDLATFCDTDPPAMPTFTAADALALIAPVDFGARFDAVQKFNDLIGIYLWPKVCKCNNGTLPDSPVAPVAPTGWPSINPPQTGTRSVTPCATGAGNRPPYPFIGVGTPAGAPSSFVPTPLPDTYVVKTKVNNEGAHPATVDFQFHFYNSAHTVIQSTLWSQTAGSAQQTRTFTTPAGTEQYDLQNAANPVSPTPTNTFDWQIDVYCGGELPTNPAAPCCPPDETLQGMVSAVLQLVTLIQRQAAPFSYVPGTVHSALSGSGEISVQGLLGAKINPSAIPQWAGIAGGDPDTLWLDSWINWGNADGWSAREFLRTAPFLSLPSVAGQYTKLGYSLANGLTVDITELKREP